MTGFKFGLINKTDGSDVTTGTPVGYFTLDDGSQSAIADTTPVHRGNGQWTVDLTAAEMNGTVVSLAFVHTDAVTVHFTIKTEDKLVSELSDFDPSTDTVSNVGLVSATTNLINLPTMPPNWITASGVSAGALDGKGDWNIGKTGYSISGSKTTLDDLQDFNASTTEVSSNIVKINGDTVPVDALALQYNGTGLTGDTYPAKQSQLSSLATGSSGLTTTSSSSVITEGAETGTHNNTFALDNVTHTLTEVAGNIDFYYEFNIGTSGVSTGVVWDGYIQGVSDNVQVFAWDWVASSWVQVGNLVGTTGVNYQSENFITTVNMTGKDANAGMVRLRLQSTEASTVNTDRILVEYTSVTSTSFILHSGIVSNAETNRVYLDAAASNLDGYYLHARVTITAGAGAGQEGIITHYDGTLKCATVKVPWTTIPNTTSVFTIVPGQVHSATVSGGYDGASVYIDGATGVAGTLIGVNGTTDNPVSNMPDARTIADAIGSKRFHFSGGSFLALDQSYQNFVFDIVQGQALDLNNQDVSGSVFLRSAIIGSMTSSVRTVFELCAMIDVTLGVCNMLSSGISGTITLANRTRYQLHDCFENGEGPVPVIDVQGDNITPTVVHMNKYSGRVELRNLTSADSILISGICRVTLHSSCSGGNIVTSGDVQIIDNSTVSPSITSGIISDIATTVDSTASDVTTIDSELAITKTAALSADAAATANNALIQGLNDMSAEDVKSKLIEVLFTDATSEPVIVPSHTDPIVDKLSYLFAFAANTVLQTSSLQTIRNFDNTLDISTATVSSDGTTTTRGKHS